MSSSDYSFATKYDERENIVAKFDHVIKLTTDCSIDITRVSFPSGNTYNILSLYECYVSCAKNKIVVSYGHYNSMRDLVEMLNMDLSPFKIAFKVKLNGRMDVVNNRPKQDAFISRSLAEMMGFYRDGNDNFDIPLGITLAPKLYDKNLGFSHVELTSTSVKDRVTGEFSFGPFFGETPKNFTWTGRRTKHCVNQSTDEIRFVLNNSRGEKIPLETGKVLVEGVLHVKH